MFEGHVFERTCGFDSRSGHFGRLGREAFLRSRAKVTYPGGEIGRRAVFRRLCLRACWFESSSGYENGSLGEIPGLRVFRESGGNAPYLCAVVTPTPLPQLPLPSPAADRPFLVAGPCSAETRDQVLETARALKAGGQVSWFRAGVWKPRTRPTEFEGSGDAALAWLAEVRETVGLPVTVEVANAAHVEAALAHGLDGVWIGARSTVSPFVVQELADALAGTAMPVWVKNPMHADLKLWLGAIERIERTVQGPVAAIHRGFSSYGLKAFRNAPMWEIPIGLRAERPELPILCDPSHITGARDRIASVAQRALDLGFHGLMIEVHPRPDEAWSDAAQQVTPEGLASLLSALQLRTSLTDPDLLHGLSALRLQIDSLDEQLVEILSNRMAVARRIGAFKKANGLAILQLERWAEVLGSRTGWAGERAVDRDFMARFLELLHEESIRIQSEDPS